MATQLEIINQVQRRLRESSTASVSTTEYSKLLGDFLNDIIEDVCNAHDWQQLESTISTNISSATDTYAITGTTNLSTLRYLGNCPQVFIYDDADDTLGYPLIELNPQLFQAYYSEGWTATADPPYFKVTASNTADNQVIQLLPAPSATRVLKTTFWTPVSSLEVDGTDDDTDIFLPTQPLVLGVMYLALNERGEELGEPGNMAEMRYYNSLSSAIYTDMQARGRTNSYEMYRD